MDISPKDMLLAALFAGLTAVGAFIRIPFPVVPLTLQVFMVLLSGFVLGPQWGALSQVAYLLLGLLGVPVFAGGGGLSYVLSPTFGYLLSWPVASWVVGRIAGGGRRSLLRNLFASLSGIGVIYAIGATVLFLNLNYAAGKAVTVMGAVKIGIIPFFAPDLLKGAVAALVALRFRRIAGGSDPLRNTERRRRT